ncbi:protein lethal(2)essential for life-like [Belonocnema kinseyi]|uniref:protein lethal(2)essential for life-like n=1 Tax=Belonocnema kinseyi TaxID=2817044 RepID=UPI00143E0469|nr:protein lethal(2)essential for life-like [Belonocnema kinseyi]
MSLVPLLLSAWWAGLDQPHILMDQNFGLGLRSEALRFPAWTDRYYFPQILDRSALTDLYYRPWADLLRTEGSGTSTITADKDTFKVILDVQQFKPEEIKVKVVNRFVVIEAKHEEKKDEHGLISRQFIRKYFVPEQVDIDQLKSSISSDGVLTITAPVKELPESEKKEKEIQIEQTGKPAIRASAEKSKETSTNDTEKEKEVRTEEGEKQDTKPEK